MTVARDTMMHRDYDEIVAHAANQAEADDQLRFELVRARKRAGLTQAQVAELTGVKQPTIAAFERYDNDPKLSTIRRYAVAVGLLVKYELEPQPCTGWAITVETPVSVSSPAVSPVRVGEFVDAKVVGNVVRQPAVGAVDSKRTDFALAS